MGDPKNTTFARRKIGRGVLWAVSALILLVVALPSIVAKTPLRNVLLGRIAAQNELRMTADAAGFGWLTPMNLRGIHIEGDQPPLKLQIERVELEKSWIATWLALPDIGRITVTSPDIELTLPELPLATSKPTPKPNSEPPAQPILGEFVVRDASFRAFAGQSHEELVQLAHLNLAVRIDASAAGRMLTIEPTTLLDRVELTPQLCDHGLHLVAPILANSTSASGAASLELTKCVVPLDPQDDGSPADLATVVGTLQLHHVQTSMKETIFRDIAAIVAGLLRVDLPDAIRIADDTEVHFELRDGRVYHEGLSFLLPEISPDMVWRTNGSVGLDESLDLVVQAQLPFTLAGDGPLARFLTDRPIELHIGGTLDEPRLEFPQDRNWWQEAASVVAGDAPSASGEAPPLADTVIELLEQARARREERVENGSPTVLDRMRERWLKQLEMRRVRLGN